MKVLFAPAMDLRTSAARTVVSGKAGYINGLTVSVVRAIVPCLNFGTKLNCCASSERRYDQLGLNVDGEHRKACNLNLLDYLVTGVQHLKHLVLLTRNRACCCRLHCLRGPSRALAPLAPHRSSMDAIPEQQVLPSAEMCQRRWDFVAVPHLVDPA